MKGKLLKFSVHLFIMLTTSAAFLQAQMIGTDIFLKGLYVEVGQCNVGSFGSCNNPPAGYHPGGMGDLGFVSDPGLDGWTVGTPPKMGDYFIPGSPHEGWDIQIGTTWNQAWSQCGNFATGGGPLILTGSNTGYEVSGRNKIANWEGQMGNLKITKRTILDTIRSFFVIEVNLENIGTTTIEDIYYNRTVDPDNEQEITGSFTTTNTIVHQPIGTEDMKCLVTAIGTTYPTMSYLGLGAKDCRATCYIVPGLSPYQPPNAIEAGTHGNTAQGFTNTSDVGIGILFNVGDLEPGGMTSLAYAYILRAEDLDTAFQLLGSSFIVDGILTGNNDTLEICRGKEVEININGGGAYVWGEWTPSDGVMFPTGRYNIITVPENTTTYRVIGTTLECDQSDTLYVTIVPKGDTVDISTAICSGDVFDFDGDILYTPGHYTKIYKTTLEGCDSVVRLNLTTNPKPGVKISADNNNICDGETANLKVENPTPNTTYQWLRNGTIIPGATERFLAVTSLPGEYRVVGLTNLGCTDTSSRITITINPAADVEIAKIDYGKVCIGDTLDFSALNTYDNYEYYWSPDKSFRYTTGVRSSNVQGVMYQDANVIKLTAYNEYGCSAVDEIVVHAVPCCDVYLPTAFSPNNDGLNDYFYMKLRDGQKLVSFQIFDRRGNLVYDNTSSRGWDGLNTDGKEVAQDVYFYRIVYSCTDGQNYEAKGDITLVR